MELRNEKIVIFLGFLFAFCIVRMSTGGLQPGTTKRCRQKDPRKTCPIQPKEKEKVAYQKSNLFDNTC